MISIVRALMKTWRLNEAKNHLRKLLDLVLTVGPQLVTLRGKEAVVFLKIADYQLLMKRPPKLNECLLNAPRGSELPFNRKADQIRELEL
jgi:prevent-host-death family protein